MNAIDRNVKGKPESAPNAEDTSKTPVVPETLNPEDISDSTESKESRVAETPAYSAETKPGELENNPSSLEEAPKTTEENSGDVVDEVKPEAVELSAEINSPVNNEVIISRYEYSPIKAIGIIFLSIATLGIATLIWLGRKNKKKKKNKKLKK